MSNFGLLVPRAVKEINEISLYGAEKIGEYAFRGTTLEKITIPKTVTSIGSYAFYGCTSLIDCTILKTDAIVTLGTNNFNSTNNKIYVPYSLLSSYKTATNWVGITDKIMGYQTFYLNQILPRYNTIHTFTWYPTKSDLIAGTNGIVADGTARATSAGEWYCDRPMNIVNLISSPKTTTFVIPTSSSNATQTQYITLDTLAQGSSNIKINATVTDYENANVKKTNSYTDTTLTATFNHSTSSAYKVVVSWYGNTQLKVIMTGRYSTLLSELWQQITITSATQEIN